MASIDVPAAPIEMDGDYQADAAIDALGGHGGNRLPGAFDDIDVFGESFATPRASTPGYVAPRSNSDLYS
ncbi:MAG: hypothetical protein ABI120_02825 [Gemmatimonadaceae bacterium]